MLKRILALTIMISVAMPIIPSRIHAADDSTMMGNVLTDTLYGGAIGALLGVGFMLLREKPADHWDYVVYGAGAGIIAGAAIGMARSTRALAEVEDGKVTMNVPELKTDIIKDQYNDKTIGVSGSISLLRYKF